MISSVTFPLLATKYPLAHRWRPQNSLFISLYSICSFLDVVPFIYCTSLLADICGGCFQQLAQTHRLLAGGGLVPGDVVNIPAGVKHAAAPTPAGVCDPFLHDLPKSLHHWFDILFGLTLLFLALSGPSELVSDILLSILCDIWYHTYNVLTFYSFPQTRR